MALSITSRLKVTVLTNGCLECRLEAAELDAFFADHPHYELCRDVKQVDLIVFLGCSFTSEKQELSEGIIDILRSRLKPGAHLMVHGCIATLCPEMVQQDPRYEALREQVARLRRFEDGRFITSAHKPHDEFWHMPPGTFSARELSRLMGRYCHRHTRWIPQNVHRQIVKAAATYRRMIDDEIDFLHNHTFCLRISTGCRGRCAYCSIRLARGSVASKPLDVVVAEFREGLKQGYRDFALLGTDIGDYGKDTGGDLIDLLKIIVEHDGDFKLRLRNVNPRWLIPHEVQMRKIAASGKIRYLLSPIESASDRVLEAMKRDYDAEPYIQAVKGIREACPSIYLKTQILVGFPGETASDYARSKELLRLRLFDYFEIYAYTPRPGTAAALLPGMVSPREVKQRYRDLMLKSIIHSSLRKTGLRI